MARITFRPDLQTEAVINEANKQTGLSPSELCRLAIMGYIAKKKPEALIRLNILSRMRRQKQEAAR